MFDPESAANEINAHVRREMSEGIGAVVIGRCMFDLGWEPGVEQIRSARRWS